MSSLDKVEKLQEFTVILLRYFYAKFCYARGHYTARVIMLGVVFLDGIVLSLIMLNVVYKVPQLICF
jgi:hypothetical protein